VDVISPFAMAWALVMLGCNWYIGEQSTRLKAILILVYLLTWSLVFVGFWAVSAAQAIFAIVVGMMTFGIDWMMGR